MRQQRVSQVCGLMVQVGEKLNATVQRQDGALSIKLVGIIDEDNHLAELVGRLGTGRALIDLADVERINSCGTRDWVNWIAELEARGIEPVLVECSPAIVAQLNLVKNFSGGAIVKSFYVPYHCPDCDVEKVLLVDVADLGPPPHEPPACRCDECDCMMDFDDMPDAYFSFLSAKHRASAAKIDNEIARGSSSTLRLRGRTSQSKLQGRASAPLLPALKPASRPAMDAVPTLAGRPASTPRVAPSGTIEPPRPGPAWAPVPAAPRSATLSLPVKLLILALLLAVGALAALVITG